MPYIHPKLRKPIDRDIESLASDIIAICDQQDDYLGILNYACTRLALILVVRLHSKIQYKVIAKLTGVFKNIGDEIYRRLGVPYENQKIFENGDVPEYSELVAQISKHGII